MVYSKNLTNAAAQAARNERATNQGKVIPHPIVEATGRPDYAEIERTFLAALHRVHEAERRHPGTRSSDRFWDGVSQALGWVIGQYHTPPEE